jgi:hypothetical protein
MALLPTLEWWVIGSLAGPIPDRALFERCLLSLATQPCSYNIHHNPPHDLSPPPSPPHYTTTSLPHSLIKVELIALYRSCRHHPNSPPICTPSTQPCHLTISDPGAKEISWYNTFFVSLDFCQGLSTTSTWISFLLFQVTLTLSLRPLLDLRGLFPHPISICTRHLQHLPPIMDSVHRKTD